MVSPSSSRTHYMDEAEFCGRVSIMVDGKIRALDTPEGLKRTFGEKDMDGVFHRLAREAHVMQKFAGKRAQTELVRCLPSVSKLFNKDETVLGFYQDRIFPHLPQTGGRC